MKLVRALLKSGKSAQGLLETGGAVRLTEGSIFADWKATDEVIANQDIESFLPPVDPPNVIAIGLNYRAHADEGGFKYPERPVVFVKLTTTVIGAGQPIRIPASAPDEVDYEAEMALVIGKAARNVSEADAHDYLLGYTAANDVSARDCQMRLDQQWARGKSFDTFCPLGPWIETEGDPDRLRVSARHNGEILQDSNTSDMIFNTRTLISFLSHQFTLLPGTVILTGTPSGIGYARSPRVFLKAGDTIEIEVGGIVLSNPVQNE